MLALTGRISAEEYSELQNLPQTDYHIYEQRPSASTPNWAESLIAEVTSIDETILANAIPGYREMTPEEREERYSPDFRSQLFDLATSGRITPEERKQVLKDLLPNRYSRFQHL
ncbi:MAG TPA: hypothetical protein VF655_04870 [Allosphingosinicella sp.]|jgi:hypothetical protein